MKCLPEMKVFCGGIGIGTTEEDVKKYFEQFGKVYIKFDFKVLLSISVSRMKN